MHPDDSVKTQFRLVPAQLAGLRRLGIATIRDLLYHFPARYDAGGESAAIAGASKAAEVTLFGTLSKLDTRRSWRRKIPVGEATLNDASGSIKIMWFHQPYLAKKFSEGEFVKVVGTVGGSDGKPYLANPHVERADKAEAGLFATPQTPDDRQLFAVYPESAGVTSLWFRHAIQKVLESGVAGEIDDPLPPDIRTRYHLPDLASAITSIHEPQKLAHAEAARKRFAFEEMFSLQIARAMERAHNDAEAAYAIRGASDRAERFLSSLDFPPTRAQQKAVQDIATDLSKPHPMARLLEGDVGAGKTLVAAAAAYATVTAAPPGRNSGTLQAAYMAPTEILAMQHFESFVRYFKHLPINIGLITGSGCRKFPSKAKPGESTSISRAQLLKWTESGEIALLIGTHALIQKSVHFKHLAFAVVDEQHRFGTRQRHALAQKSAGDGAEGENFSLRNSLRSDNPRARFSPSAPSPASAPHFLSMTATPIPRTLALTMYGDLDISVLDELPPGRAAIVTKIVPPQKRNDAYETARLQLREGRQMFVVCPRIEEPDPEKLNALQAKSAKAEAKRLAKDVFPEYAVGLLHGAMKPAEKDAAMKAFASGETQILVATSVIEVGVDVPNAAVIVIEGAERFGLAQLHQLRGRVMRSSHPPLCFLFTESRSDLSLARLRSLEKSQDGFVLAEADLAARGAGDLSGVRQWGVSDLGMEALKNAKLIKAARDEAQGLVARDPSLSNFPALAERARAVAHAVHAE